MKTCSSSLVVKSRQIKITLRYHYTPAKNKRIDNTKCWQGRGAEATYVHYLEKFGLSYKNQTRMNVWARNNGSHL
jgi:hypothetical protein